MLFMSPRFPSPFRRPTSVTRLSTNPDKPVLKRGDWVGRPEVVHIGGANGADYQINWRVDKVRDGDIVFTREDPAQPGIPPATRVIAIRPENENNPRERL